MPNPETLGHNELNCEEHESAFIGRLDTGVTIVARDTDVLKRVRVDVQSHDVEPSVVMPDLCVGADAKRRCDNVVARYGRRGIRAPT